MIHINIETLLFFVRNCRNLSNRHTNAWKVLGQNTTTEISIYSARVTFIPNSGM